MIISPPFLPARLANISDAAFVTDAMPVAAVTCPGTSVPEGSFPISLKLGWHGGTHLHAPHAGNATLPVRAIADGEIVFARKPTAPNTEIAHPLNYNPYGSSASWTDDGMVIIRHSTDIGDGDMAHEVVFYSIIMHLSELKANVLKVARGSATAAERRIYRKDEIGLAGRVYSAADHIHIEIACDDTNLRKLLGRTTGLLSYSDDGRSDAIYGEMYFHIPSGAQVFSEKPVAQLTTAHSQPAKPNAHAALPSPVPMTALYTTTEACIIGLRYAGGDGITGHLGDAYLSTYQLNGSLLGAPVEDPGGEYDLYARADAISKAHPESARPAPSAVYELLRFGRVINTANETLTPNDCPHWRRVRYDGGEGWINLNAANITKFSDADFPHWKGWKLIDDDTDDDSRSDSALLTGIIEDASNADGKLSRSELERRVGLPEVRLALNRTICKFPSEWNQDSVDARWGWLQTDPEFKLEGEDWDNFRKHIVALTIPASSLPEPLRGKHWHFHPLSFITHFRRCGWLSLREMARLIPRQMGRSHSGTDIAWTQALQKLDNPESHIRAISINQVFRKYGFNSVNRQTAFFAQVYIETGLLRLTIEGGAGALSTHQPMTRYYAAFYGRGLMQLTWASAYEAYGQYRKFPNHVGHYVDPRITATSTHYWAAPTTDAHGHVHSDQRLWSPRYDPAIVASDDYNVCDSACFYWITKSFLGQKNIHRIADEGITTETIGKMSILVNGGGNGYNDRQQYGSFVFRYHSDVTDTSIDETLRVTRQIIHTVNHHTVWGTSGVPVNVYVNYTAQRE